MRACPCCMIACMHRRRHAGPPMVLSWVIRAVQVMNGFLGEAIRITHGHGGQVIKFAGDALFAIFEVMRRTRHSCL